MPSFPRACVLVLSAVLTLRETPRAGNYGSNSDVVKDTPTNFGLDIMVSVAASDLQDAIPAYSNYGAGRVHLAAPGSEILSTVPNGRYYVLSGARPIK